MKISSDENGWIDYTPQPDGKIVVNDGFLVLGDQVFSDFKATINPGFTLAIMLNDLWALRVDFGIGTIEVNHNVNA